MWQLKDKKRNPFCIISNEKNDLWDARYFFFAYSLQIFVIQKENAEAFMRFASNSSSSGKRYFCLRKKWKNLSW